MTNKLAAKSPQFERRMNMKKIKTVNGWVIYQIINEKNAEKHNSEIGSYVRFSQSEIECYGLQMSEVDIDYGYSCFSWFRR